MSKKNLIVGIDVGSSFVRTIIAQVLPQEENLRVIGVGSAPSFGVRKGIIVDLEEITRSISESLLSAERVSGVEVKSAMVAIGGNHISAQSSKGVIAVGKADGEVSSGDVARVISAAQAISIPPNKEIIHIIPKSYALDDQKNIRDPLGMNGVRLEVDALIIEGLTPHIKNLNKCINEAGVVVDGFVLSSLAAAKAVLTKRQKELGVVLVDIGGGSTSIIMFEENDLLRVAVVPVGGSHITNDIAIGLRTSIDVAERVKLEFGNAMPQEISKKENIDLSQIDSNEEGIVSRYHVAEIIEARLEEIFTLVNKELKLAGKEQLLPAGAVITGGTAKLPGCVDLAKNILALPAQTGFPIPLGGLVDKVDDPAFSTAVGLVLWGMEENQSIGGGMASKSVFLGGKFKEMIEKLRRIFGKFLP